LNLEWEKPEKEHCKSNVELEEHAPRSTGEGVIKIRIAIKKGREVAGYPL